MKLAFDTRPSIDWRRTRLPVFVYAHSGENPSNLLTLALSCIKLTKLLCTGRTSLPPSFIQIFPRQDPLCSLDMKRLPANAVPVLPCFASNVVPWYKDYVVSSYATVGTKFNPSYCRNCFSQNYLSFFFAFMKYKCDEILREKDWWDRIQWMPLRVFCIVRDVQPRCSSFLPTGQVVL